MKLVSPLSYIKKTENYIKRKIKTYTKKNEKLAQNLSLLHPLPLSLRLQVFIGEM